MERKEGGCGRVGAGGGGRGGGARGGGRRRKCETTAARSKKGACEVQVKGRCVPVDVSSAHELSDLFPPSSSIRRTYMLHV
jgi:hypothetical protein